MVDSFIYASDPHSHVVRRMYFPQFYREGERPKEIKQHA